MRTSDLRFLQLLPWLMLAAAITFTVGGRVAEGLRRRSTRCHLRARPADHGAEGAKAAASSPQPRAPAWILLFQFVIATYGGYFGGGMGIVMLAAFSVAGMTQIHEMNGVKALLAVLINGVGAGSGDGGRRHSRRLLGRIFCAPHRRPQRPRARYRCGVGDDGLFLLTMKGLGTGD